MKSTKKTSKSRKPSQKTEGEAVNSSAPTIDKSHYTPQGEHPEDRIYRDREYIERLQAHIDSICAALEKDLGIKNDSTWLFDFIHNEDRNIEFEDYLGERGVRYKDIVQSKKKQSPSPRRKATVTKKQTPTRLEMIAIQ